MKDYEIPSAFPRHIENQWSNEFTSGMTLRDYFANSAMQSLIAMFLGHSSKQDISKMSYEIADEMLKQREL